MVALRACISMAHAINGLKREHHQLMHPVQYMSPKQTRPRPIELSSSTTHQEAIYLLKQCRNIYCMYDVAGTALHSHANRSHMHKMQHPPSAAVV